MPTILRDPSGDKLKSGYMIKKQRMEDKRCIVDGCGKPITTWIGPGDKTLCRAHQLDQREYGGMGRKDRLWTFSREWTCSWCGYNPKEDPWFNDPSIQWESEVHKHQTMRGMLVGDHIIRQADGGSHDKENVKTLCQNCNCKKTNLKKDYTRSSINLG